MKLYDLTSSYQALLDKVSEQGGDLTQEDLDALDAVEMAFEDKVDGYAAVIQTMKLHAEDYDIEERRLWTRRKILQNSIQAMKDRLAVNMARLNQTAVKGKRFNVRLNHSQSVEVVDEAAVPDQYKITEVAVVKALVKSALESGEDVPGCRLKQNESVVIR